jgi:hypothetical protein
MKRKKELLIYGIGFLLMAFVMTFMQSVSQAAAPEAWQHKTILGEVVEINLDAREITLMDKLKNQITFAVDTKVKNLGEIAVGNKVAADYYISLAKEMRRPTAEEKKTPFMVLDETETAPPMSSPKAGGLKQFKAVATISGTDRFLQMIQLEGPRGNIVTVRASNPNWLGGGDMSPEVRVGDTVIVTYTQPLIISLEKK